VSGLLDNLGTFLASTGFAHIAWENAVMLGVALVLLYLAIVKQFEPLLLVPIGFGALAVNIPLTHTWLMGAPQPGQVGGVFWYIYQGVELEIFPPLIFMGVGAMTDFGPLIAAPRTLLLGAAAQFGIFGSVLGATLLGFTTREAASIGIIGGADGPTAIFTSIKLAPHLLGPIAVAAYSYMALVPLIQPPIMKLLTTKRERRIQMRELRTVSKREKVLFPILVAVICSMLVPPASPLILMLMFGNLIREIGIVERLVKTAQNELVNLITILLGLSVGMTMDAAFLDLKTLGIIVMGALAFAFATASGLMLAKVMNLFTKDKINPLIGAAGVSAVPMAARVAHIVGQRENPQNYLLMHAMGPNVAGVIGTAVAAGVLISLLS